MRGKPWTVAIDDFIFANSDRSPVFAALSSDSKTAWGIILEKGWAKVKGNYMQAQAGLFEEGITGLTGMPVFTYQTNQSSLDYTYS